MAVPVLENRSFLLGVEERWDKYYEVNVKFLRKVEEGEHSHFLFVDEQSGVIYWLSPRYVGDTIPLVTAKDVTVNIGKQAAASSAASKGRLIFFGTGVLKLIHS